MGGLEINSDLWCPFAQSDDDIRIPVPVPLSKGGFSAGESWPPRRRRCRRRSPPNGAQGHRRQTDMAHPLVSPKDDAPNPRERLSIPVILPRCSELGFACRRDYLSPNSWLDVVFWTAAPQQRVVVANKHGENLVGMLHHAAGSNKVVVLCHGFAACKVHMDMSSSEEEALPFLCRTWLARSVALFCGSCRKL
jgi:hypothetical protein